MRNAATALLLALALAPPAPALPAPKRDPAVPEPAKPFTEEESKHFVVNDATEITLDGKAVKFGDVPPSASVVSLEVAPDRKTIVKIAFQSKGK